MVIGCGKEFRWKLARRAVIRFPSIPSIADAPGRRTTLAKTDDVSEFQHHLRCALRTLHHLVWRWFGNWRGRIKEVCFGCASRKPEARRPNLTVEQAHTQLFHFLRTRPTVWFAQTAESHAVQPSSYIPIPQRDLLSRRHFPRALTTVAKSPKYPWLVSCALTTFSELSRSLVTPLG